jgi:hypothetical protein
MGKLSHRVPSRSLVKRNGPGVCLDHPQMQELMTSLDDLLFAVKQ